MFPAMLYIYANSVAGRKILGNSIPFQVKEELEEGRFLPLSGELYVGVTLVQLPPVHSEGQE